MPDIHNIIQTTSSYEFTDEESFATEEEQIGSITSTSYPSDTELLHSLEQFGFNDTFNVVAYSTMSVGKCSDHYTSS